jgi:hypothetical protein
MKTFLKLLVMEAAFLFGAVALPAQTPTPGVGSFSITANAISLPGSNGSTLAGTLAGVNLKITPNFFVEQTNFISSSAQTNAFLAGGNYTLPFLSKKLNNASPNLSGYDFRFSIHGDVGAARISNSTGNVAQGLGALFGGQVDYAIHGSQMFSLAVRVDDFFVNKGLPHKNNLVIAVGPTIHF